MGLGLLFLSVFGVTGSLASLVIGGSLFTLILPSLLYVRRLARAGRIGPSLLVVSASLWLLALLIASRGPAAMSAAVPMLVLPTIVSIFYLTRRAFTYVTLGSFAALLIAATVSAFAPNLPSNLTPDQLSTVVLVATVLIFGTALVALWDVGSLARDALADAREKNLALLESERHLEEKVEARTSEIEEKNSELEGALSEVSDIHGIARVANATLDLDRVMEAVMTALRRVFPFDQMGILLFDAERRILRFEHAIGTGVSSALLARLREIDFPADGDSLFAQVARNREPIFVPYLDPDPDSLSSPEAAAAYREDPVGSLLACSLEVEAEVIGTIVFGYSPGALELEASEIERIQRYLPQLSMAIRNARLFEEAETARAQSLERAAELADVDAIGRATSASLNLDDVLDVVMETLQKLFRFNQLAVCLFDADKSTLSLSRAIGAGFTPEVRDALAGSGIPSDEEGSAFLYVARSGTPFYLRDIETDLRMSPSDQRYFEANPPKSLLIVPLEVDAEIVGIIYFGNNIERIELDSEDIDRIRRYVTPVSIAIHNARLFEQTQAARAETERAMLEISDVDAIGRAASASLDLDAVLERVSEALRALFEFDQLCLGLLDSERKGLVLTRMLGAGFTEEVRALRSGTAIPTDAKGSVFLYVARTGEPFYLSPVPEDLPVHPADRLYPETNRPKSVLILPLEVNAEVVGILYFGNSVRPTEMSPAEIERVRRYVTPIAIAIHNARLFEETRAARAEALEASRTKSRFLANMSHELRTPLNAVIGYSEMLQEEAREAGIEGFVDDLEKIRGSGRHLLELINEVLDLSKVEAGRMELDLEDFAVEEIVREVITTVTPMAEANRNALVFEPGDERLGDMHSDPTKVRQILLNLLANACKFTENGVVRVAVERSNGGSDRMTFTVSDTGIGMTAEQSERVFEAFAQADSTTTREYGGTGLGLAITRQFCELLGGSIEVRSEPGVGTRFDVDLPATAKKEGG